ncbi:MAG: hypothetical protein P8Q55_04195 [Candidatus Poseidoniaceae archaeon]|mgnify:FL=1|jgi:hypothetical protein|nr:hypothetical protein [Candidatus Poseidoniaceae archaeon]
MFESILLFVFGSFIGFISPRLPILMVTRAKGFNYHFSQHPEPVSLSPHLTQRVIHMRTFYWLGLGFSLIPIAAGYASIIWGSAPLGFGMWISSGWAVINKLQTFIGGNDPPWTYEMAIRLQVVMNNSTKNPCCEFSEPEWQLTAVRCASCKITLDEMPRPDLGRKRSDGIIVGSIRLLASGGYPVVSEHYDD